MTVLSELTRATEYNDGSCKSLISRYGVAAVLGFSLANDSSLNARVWTPDAYCHFLELLLFADLHPLDV